MRSFEGRSGRAGLSLVEVLVASVVLAVVGTVTMGIFSTSTQSIGRTDQRRELRMHMREIFAHINRQSLHSLWDFYGPDGHGPPRRLLGQLALLDGSGKLVPAPGDGPEDQTNPLGFTQGFLDELRAAGLDARIAYDFYTRAELGYSPEGEPSPEVGLLHMQAGWAEVRIFSREDPDERSLMVWKQPIMCPAVVGRPGLKLSSCPAINPRVKCQYGPLLAGKEGFDLSEAEEEDCTRRSEAEAGSVD